MTKFTCETCGFQFEDDEMFSLDPVMECCECYESRETYWAAQYDASSRKPEVTGGYDLDDPKHPEWVERLMERAGV